MELNEYDFGVLDGIEKALEKESYPLAAKNLRMLIRKIKREESKTIKEYFIIVGTDVANDCYNVSNIYTSKEDAETALRTKERYNKECYIYTRVVI